MKKRNKKKNGERPKRKYVTPSWQLIDFVSPDVAMRLREMAKRG